eukprot:403360044
MPLQAKQTTLRTTQLNKILQNFARNSNQRLEQVLMMSWEEKLRQALEGIRTTAFANQLLKIIQITTLNFELKMVISNNQQEQQRSVGNLGKLTASKFQIEKSQVISQRQQNHMKENQSNKTQIIYLDKDKIIVDSNIKNTKEIEINQRLNQTIVSESNDVKLNTNLYTLNSRVGGTKISDQDKLGVTTRSGKNLENSEPYYYNGLKFQPQQIKKLSLRNENIKKWKEQRSLSLQKMRHYCEENYYHAYINKVAQKQILKEQERERLKQEDEYIRQQAYNKINQEQKKLENNSEEDNNMFLQELKNNQKKLTSKHRMLNTINKIKNEDYRKDLKKAFQDQSESIKRMSQAYKDFQGKGLNHDDIEKQEDFMQKLLMHEERMKNLNELDSLQMVQGGSIGISQEIKFMHKILNLTIGKDYKIDSKIELTDFLKIFETNAIMDQAFRSLASLTIQKIEQRHHSNSILLQKQNKLDFEKKLQQQAQQMDEAQNILENQKKRIFLDSLHQKQLQVQSSMKTVQKLLILKQVIADLHKYAPLMLLKQKKRQSYQDREKYVKERQIFEKEIGIKYHQAQQFFKKLLHEYYDNPEQLEKDHNQNLKAIFKVFLNDDQHTIFSVINERINMMLNVIDDWMNSQLSHKEKLKQSQFVDFCNLKYPTFSTSNMNFFFAQILGDNSKEDAKRGIDQKKFLGNLAKCLIKFSFENIYEYLISQNSLKESMPLTLQLSAFQRMLLLKNYKNIKNQKKAQSFTYAAYDNQKDFNISKIKKERLISNNSDQANIQQEPQKKKNLSQIEILNQLNKSGRGNADYNYNSYAKEIQNKIQNLIKVDDGIKQKVTFHSRMRKNIQNIDLENMIKIAALESSSDSSQD